LTTFLVVTVVALETEAKNTKSITPTLQKSPPV